MCSYVIWCARVGLRAVRLRSAGCPNLARQPQALKLSAGWNSNTVEVPYAETRQTVYT